MRFPYNQADSPPSPVATLTLKRARGDKGIRLENCLIDTGADSTIIPGWVARKLKLRRWGNAWVTGLFGGLRTGIEAYVILELDEFSLDGFVVVLEDDITILGRDILNRLTLVLDGKKTVVEL